MGIQMKIPFYLIGTQGINSLTAAIRLRKFHFPSTYIAYFKFQFKFQFRISVSNFNYNSNQRKILMGIKIGFSLMLTVNVFTP